jgi:hypothetical protein
MEENEAILEDGKLAINVFIISFLLGTTLFILYITSKNESVLFMGFLYVLVTVFFNSIIVLKLFYLLITSKNHSLYLLKRIGIVCLNIPITIIYLNILFNHYL